MPKSNTHGGKKSKGKKRGNRDRKHVPIPLIEDPSQRYVELAGSLGGNRLTVTTTTGDTMQATIRGKMFKKQWMRIGDILFAEDNPLKPKECMILHKYSPDEITILKDKKLIDNFNLAGKNKDNVSSDIVFENVPGEDSSDSEDDEIFKKLDNFEKVKKSKDKLSEEKKSDEDSESEDEKPTGVAGKLSKKNALKLDRRNQKKTKDTARNNDRSKKRDADLDDSLPSMPAKEVASHNTKAKKEYYHDPKFAEQLPEVPTNADGTVDLDFI